MAPSTLNLFVHLYAIHVEYYKAEFVTLYAFMMMIIMALQSLNLVQYVHNLCARRGLQFESEFYCQWLMIFVRMVNFEDNLETFHLYLGQFLGSEPAVLRIKAVHDTVVKYVSMIAWECNNNTVMHF